MTGSRWPKRTPFERFWAKTKLVGSCIEWTAATGYGYGKFRVRGVDGKWAMPQAHRWLYEQVFGPINDRYRVLLHSCDNRRCVALQHLTIGTAAQNVADCIAKGRQAVGTAMPHAKLDEDRVRLIRQLARDGWSQRRIADHLGDVSRELVRDILKGKRWKHVED